MISNIYIYIYIYSGDYALSIMTTMQIHMYNTNMYIFADKMIKRYIWIFERCGAVQIYNQENWSTKVV